MEGRGRLAQSLTLKRRVSFALWTRSYEPRWWRGARCWGIWLVNLKIPQGAGASAAAMLLLASVSYGAIKGGHGSQILENLQDLCDAAANKAGFRITEVGVTHYPRTAGTSGGATLKVIGRTIQEMRNLRADLRSKSR